MFVFIADTSLKCINLDVDSFHIYIECEISVLKGRNEYNYTSLTVYIYHPAVYPKWKKCLNNPVSQSIKSKTPVKLTLILISSFCLW